MLPYREGTWINDCREYNNYLCFVGYYLSTCQASLLETASQCQFEFGLDGNLTSPTSYLWSFCCC